MVFTSLAANMGLIDHDVALYAHKSVGFFFSFLFLLFLFIWFFSSFKLAPGCVQTGLEAMKAAGVLCRSLQRAVCVESPRLVPGKGGASGGLSSALVRLGSAPGMELSTRCGAEGWSMPPCTFVGTFTRQL